jgi:hypothetical protein
MVDEAARDVGPADAWEVENLRATAFSHGASRSAVGDQWKALVGAEPATVTSAPREGTHQAEGPFGKGRLYMGEAPERSDLVYAAPPDVNPDSGGFLVLGRLPAVVAEFLPIAMTWLGAPGPAMDRLAFGVVLKLPAANRHDAYRSLSKYLPAVQVDPEGSSDILYRINRWRTSKAASGLNINRLSTWTVIAVTHLRFTPDGRALITAPLDTQGHAVRVELDMNTALGSDAKLLGRHSAAVLEEEVQLASEIARKGDVP